MPGMMVAHTVTLCPQAEGFGVTDSAVVVGLGLTMTEVGLPFTVAVNVPTV
ncbi:MULTISPECIES: hypothetical protein [Streptomyces]|uniref:hypothetical protein n=1 Tax=Streptomyces TaxID=1883 RepID=UPI001839A243|nr:MULTISPECIES: hypothetical protein [Streptomyces]MBA9044357.1 hypothetical protein [Streptomyces murinus]